jgi:hypothetical protein
VPNYALSRLERLYAQIQSAYGTIPNTTGTATVGNANAFRSIKASMDNDIATIERQDKTGSRTRTAGVAGRRFGKWSLEASLAPNGTAGVKPDFDPILQGIFGQAGTVTTATAGNGFPTGTTVVDASACVKYALSDNIIPFALWSFRQPSTLDQRVAHSCVVNQSTFNLGQDGAATYTADGEAAWVLSSNQFSAADSVMKGGLTAFPTEPSAPVTNGGIIAGFTGVAMTGSDTLATLRNASVTIAPGNMAIKDQFGSYLPTGTEGDVRKVTTKLSIYEDDSTAFSNLIAAANSQTPINVLYQIGTVPGSIVVIQVKGVQLISPSREEQRRFIANFPDSPASGSGSAAKDEVTFWFC